MKTLYFIPIYVLPIGLFVKSSKYLPYLMRFSILVSIFFFFWIFFYIERDKYNYKYLWKIPFAIIILAHLIGLFYKSLSVVKILRIYIILVLISFFRHPFSTISNPYFI